jgi:hypothetical protein
LWLLHVVNQVLEGSDAFQHVVDAEVQVGCLLCHSGLASFFKDKDGSMLQIANFRSVACLLIASSRAFSWAISLTLEAMTQLAAS